MLISLLLAFAPASPQTTWYVDASAPGPGSGTLADPYARIDYAASQPSTVSGDTILIEPGTYAGEDIEILGKALRLEASASPGSVMINGPGGFPQSGSGSSSLIRVQGPAVGTTELIGLSFAGGIGEDDGTSIRGGAAFFQDAAVHLENCSFEGRAHFGGGIFSQGSELTALDSTVRGVGTPPDFGGGSSLVIGGAILASEGSVDLTDCDVVGGVIPPFPEPFIRGESTAFLSCSAVTITRGSIRPGGGSSGQYYSTGGRIFAVGTTLRVDQTTLANGGYFSSRGTGIAAAGGDVHVTGVTFDMGQTLRIQGDGMHLTGCTTLVEDCTFRNCGGSEEADGTGTDFFYYGGAIFSGGSTLCTVLNSTFIGNRGGRGGAIYADNARIENCSFQGNSAFGSFTVPGLGGAVRLATGVIQSCTFSGNFASGNWGPSSGSGFGSRGFGGAVFVVDATIDRCRFEGNQVNNHIMPYASEASIQALLVGGALYAQNVVTLRDSSFSGNSIVPRTFAFDSGSLSDLLGCGAYLAQGGVISGCTFEGNGVQLGTFFAGTRWLGGGLFAEEGAVTIEGSTFAGNEAERGGAIYNEGANVDISLSVLRGNRSEDLVETTLTPGRPAIAGDATLVRCTVAGHESASAAVAGDVLLDGGGVDSSILYGNAGLALPAALPVTYSIVEGGHGGVGNLDVDPLFIESFSDVRLWPASPAIDAGSPLLFDESTLSRADMGARPRQASDCGTVCADPIGAALCLSNPNSTGFVGEAQAFGSDVAADEFLLLSATQLPLSVAGYFVTSDVAGFVPNFGGSDGNLCLGMPLYRLSDQVLNTGTSGRVGRAVDTQALPQGQVVAAGSTWTFQLWHRDPMSATSSSNTTSAVSVTFL